VKAVPATLLVKVTEVTLPEHSVCEPGVAVTVGIGLTVTVTTIGAPEHPAPVGVIVYVAVPALVEVALNVCAITVPELAEAPLTFVCATVQLKVVPPVLLVRAMFVALPEQILCELGVADTDGAGLTVTVAVIGDPAQVAAVGVIVYTAVPALAVVAVSV
jgi:hypothetical protein